MSYPVVCRRCTLVTGSSPDKGKTVLCHACSWAVIFEEKLSTEPPYGSRPTELCRELAGVLTEAHPHLAIGSANSLPDGVVRASVNASDEGEN